MKVLNLFLIIFLFLTKGLNAQPKLGIVAGLNLPWQRFEVSGSGGPGTVAYDMLTTFHAGLVSEIIISSKINFQPGLQVSGKGGQISSQALNGATVNRKIELYYLEMPLVFNYNMNVAKNRIFIGAGPAIAYGLSGKDRQTFFTHDAFELLFKRFDAGLILQTGFRTKYLQVSAAYDMGLVNIFNNDNPNLPPGQIVDWRNKTLGISLAYLFDMKK